VDLPRISTNAKNPIFASDESAYLALMTILVSQLADEQLKDFLSKIREPDARRKAAQDRIDIELEDFAHLVERRIDEVYNDPIVRSEIKKFSDISVLNPLKNITDRLAVAYKNVPNRSLEGASVSINEKFQRLLNDGRIGIIAKDWLKWSLVTNVVLVIPTVIDNKVRPQLRWQLFLPNNLEVITMPEDPTEVAMAGYMFDEERVCVLDSEGWWIYDDKDELLEVRRHGLGIFPGTVVRLSSPTSDFWSSTKGKGMVDATVEVCHLMATMAWVRKGQNRKGMTLAAADLDKAMAEGQLLLSEKPIEVNADPNEFEFNVHDMVTSVDEFEKHVRLLYHEVAEQQGLPSFLIDFPSSANAMAPSGITQAQQHSRLAEVREDHVQWLRYAEEDLMWKTTMMAKQFNHPDAVDPGVVREQYTIVWPPLTFVDDPLKKLQVWKDKISLNIGFSQVDAVQEAFPGITRTAAVEKIRRALEERKVVADFQSEFNLASDPTEDAQSSAEENGRMGGRISGIVRDTTPDSGDAA